MVGLAVVLLAAGPAALLAGPAEARVGTSGIRVHLEDPGSTPRSLLRIQPGSTPARRIVTFTTEVMQSGIATQTVGPLAIQTTIAFSGTTKGPGGTIQLPYKYEGFQLLASSVGTPEELAAVRAALSQSPGLGGQFTLSPTGAVVSGHISVPSGTSSALRSLLQQLSDQSTQLSVPLPTQAVGVGAHWRATTQLTVGGISLTQTYDYTLRAHDGTTVALDVSYVQSAPRQRVKSKSFPSNETVTVTTYRIAGTGTSTIDLSQVAPMTGHVAAQGIQVFRVQQGRQSRLLNQQLQIGVDVAPG